MPRIKHAVFMRLKSDTPPAKIEQMFAVLRGLQAQIPGIEDFSGGAGCSVEGLERGHTHAFVITFADLAARDRYLPHPAHEVAKAAIIELLDGGIDGVTVMDWEDRG
ncbi:MAG: Dabb family protein [Pirellulales bacterium]|nr:Dabb family protein [Pirellulales bacterium]